MDQKCACQVRDRREQEAREPCILQHRYCRHHYETMPTGIQLPHNSGLTLFTYMAFTSCWCASAIILNHWSCKTISLLRFEKVSLSHTPPYIHLPAPWTNPASWTHPLGSVPPAAIARGSSPAIQRNSTNAREGEGRLKGSKEFQVSAGSTPPLFSGSSSNQCELSKCTY